MHYTVSSFVFMALVGVPTLLSSVLHEFYPVNVGDRWEYESSIRGRFSNEVVSSAGSTHRVRSVDASGRVSHFEVEVRGDSVRVGADQRDAGLLVDFGNPLGGSFIGTHGATAEIVTFKAEHERLDVLGRVFADVREYQHKGEAGLVYSTFYARGIGLVGMQWETGITVRLVAAEVAGRRVE